MYNFLIQLIINNAETAIESSSLAHQKLNNAKHHYSILVRLYTENIEVLKKYFIYGL